MTRVRAIRSRCTSSSGGIRRQLITVQDGAPQYSGWFLDAADAPTEVKDYDHDKVADRMVKFSRQDFITALGGDTGNVSIIVDGN